jgi:hypothetical protein
MPEYATRSLINKGIPALPIGHTYVETETAAPLKSEIGDGRRRLLFRDAVAAMSFSLFLCSASPLSLSSPCLHCYKPK